MADVIKKEHASNNKQDPLTNAQCEDFLAAFDTELKRQNKQYRQKKVMIQEAVLAGDRDRLSQLAVSEGGLLSDEVRESVRSSPVLTNQLPV